MLGAAEVNKGMFAILEPMVTATRTWVPIASRTVMVVEPEAIPATENVEPVTEDVASPGLLEVAV
jgi:hypothetical protein